MSEMLRILITVWIAGHPTSLLLKHEYAATGRECEKVATGIFARRKKGVHMTVECVDQRPRSA